MRIAVALIIVGLSLAFVKCTNGQNERPLRSATKVPFKNMLGINAFEWNFLQNPADPNDPSRIYEPKMQVIKTFAGVRHYLDWKRIEPVQGRYSFNPSHEGGWNFDAMYERCKSDGLDVLVCLKTCPDWLLNTYPADQRDPENIPMPFGSNKADPKSYTAQARAAFQFAARYGNNKHIDTSLIRVDTSPRWTRDPVNTVKIGTGLIRNIECDNERDKWWKGDKAHQNAEEYAANLSAFYDGHKGALGKGVGVKSADPSMKVVIGGLASADPNYVATMIKWCERNRGRRPNGSIDLCFDVINYHYYANDHLDHNNTATAGIAPELSEATDIAKKFVALGDEYHLPVWVTEAGYDVNEKSPQRAIIINATPILTTQADWTIRTALLYARCGIQRCFFYELYDDNLQSPTQYSSSGMITADLKRRPAANYISQSLRLLGDHVFERSISEKPVVDVYEHGSKRMYVLYMPSQTGATTEYELKLPASAKHVNIWKLNAAGPDATKEIKGAMNGAISLKVTETPIFVQIP